MPRRTPPASRGTPIETNELAPSSEVDTSGNVLNPAPPSRWTGPVLCALAAVLWSTSAFFARSPAFEEWPLVYRGAVIAMWRAVFALLLLFPLVRRVSWDWRMVPMAICFAAMNWTYLTALVGGPPENAIWLQNLSPAWVMLVSVFVLREPTIPKDWWMVALCISGVLFILLMQNRFSEPSIKNQWWAPWLAIASGMLYAGVILSLRTLRAHDPAWLIAVNHVVTALAMVPLVLQSGAGWPHGSMWFLLIGVGVLQMGTPYFLFARGLKSTPGHIASLITLLEPVLLPVWVYLARGGEPDYEPAPWWTWVGALLILSGLLLCYFPIPVSDSPIRNERNRNET